MSPTGSSSEHLIPSEVAATRILRNGRIWPAARAEAAVEALAIRGEHILAAGSDEDVTALAGPQTEVVDLAGLTVVPGFIDPHVHMPEAYAFDRVLEASPSFEALLEGLGQRIQRRPAGSWGYVSMSLNRPEWWPRRAQLDAMSGDHPVFLNLSGHVYAANSRGLALAGIGRDTPDPFGGRIDRDAEGEPTGILFDTARFLVLGVMPRETELELAERILTAQQVLLRAGITTAHDMVPDPEITRTYQRLREDGRLKCRTVLLLRAYESKMSLASLVEAGVTTGLGDDWLRVGGIKLSLDGQFPSRGALVSEPYLGHDHDCGTLRIPADEFKRLVKQAHDAGLRVCVHAVGDGAQQMAIDAFEAVAGGASLASRRHRIEHYGNLQSDAATRAQLARLGVFAMPNPTFLAARGHLVEPYLGTARAQSVTNIRELIDSGVRVAVGSDWPGLGNVEPLKGIRALATRVSDTGLPLQPEAALSPAEALELYTASNAYIDFSEDRKGRLDPGKLADLVVLSDDLLATAPQQLGGVKVLATMVGGEFVHEDQTGMFSRS
jgi:predicted amidohydrolase YtcJ